MAAKGGAGEEYLQTVSEVKPAGGYNRPSSAQEMGYGGNLPRKELAGGGSQEGVLSYWNSVLLSPQFDKTRCLGAVRPSTASCVGHNR